LEGSGPHMIDVLSQNLFGVTEEYDETPRLALQVTWAVFELCDSRMHPYSIIFRPSCAVSTVGIQVRKFLFHLSLQTLLILSCVGVTVDGGRIGYSI
jgi:hypothetical protein